MLYTTRDIHMITLLKSSLRLAGWLSVISAILGAPLAVLGFVAGFSQNTELEVISTLVGLVYAGIFAYVYAVFKQLLNERYHFRAADFALWVYITLGVASALLQVIVGIVDRQTGEILNKILFFSVIPAGAAGIMIGIKLLRLKDDLYGLRKQFSYLTMAFGACLASIVLLPFTILLGVVSDILLALILLRASRE